VRSIGFASIASALVIGLASGGFADVEGQGEAASGDFEVLVVRGASVSLASGDSDGRVREVMLREDPRPARSAPVPTPRPARDRGEDVTIVVLYPYPVPRYVVGYPPSLFAHSGFIRHKAHRHRKHRPPFYHPFGHHAVRRIGPPPIYPVVINRPASFRKPHGRGHVRRSF
jgi:hypothetical protein